MMRLIAPAAGALLCALVPAAPAQAQDYVTEKKQVVLKPGLAYVYVRSPHARAIRLMRVVDDAQRADWARERAKAFAQAQAYHQQDLRRYEARLKSWNRLPANARYLEPKPQKPAEPTEAAFAFPDPEVGNFLDVAGLNRFTKGPDGNSWLIGLRPGNYIIYGQITEGPNGPIGVCLCMGTVKFEAEAGKIVDLGTIRYPREEAGEESGKGKQGRLPPLAIQPAGVAELPDRLRGRPVEPAKLRASEKLSNYFGVLIDRLPAIPGILEYRRDKVMDPQAGEGTR